MTRALGRGIPIGVQRSFVLFFPGFKAGHLASCFKPLAPLTRGEYHCPACWDSTIPCSMASTPENTQKRPRKCRTCLQPMKGHKAENCIPVQQIALPVTPPATPANTKTNNNRNDARNNVEIGLERHWRDPSWTPEVTLPPAPILSDGSSLVPTVLVDEDGNTILGSQDACAEAEAGASDDAESVGDQLEAAPDLRRPKSPMAHVMDQAHALMLCDPVLSIVKVSMADLPRMQATAGQSGLCTSIVRTPWNAPRFKEEFEPTVHWMDEKNVWVVVGDDPALVQRTAELQPQYEKTPGALKDDVVVVQATYMHIFVASTLGAFLVVAVLSFFV
ncbi:hypothetical protein MSAN_01496600 [Mycena sanguinolenta]|uniref:Uncharacterized protein n=1 Tax=Mycena sanguinolenta TaxID=230812 RepID=A0A8H6Y7M3_9AGAR|nr:hypothetical protein MSAN_01496600 [Mycena sanguinolenta]